MSRMYRLYSLLFALVFLGPCVSRGQTQPGANQVPWDEVRTVAQEFRQNLVSGNAQPAHMRVLQMQMLMGAAPQAAKVGRQIEQMEKRPIPEDNDPSLSRFLPLADDLLKAIGEADATAASSLLWQLNSKLGAAGVVHSRQSIAALPRDAKDSAILDLQYKLEHAMHANDVAKVTLLAPQMQAMIDDLVSKHQYVTDYAFNHYMVNDALGRAAFQRGDYEAASDYLQKAAEIPSDVNGIVELDNFGPNLWLAEQLVRVGKTDLVLRFLQTCKERFWHNENDKADPWIAALQSRKPSDLSPNSDAGYGYLEQ